MKFTTEGRLGEDLEEKKNAEAKGVRWGKGVNGFKNIAMENKQELKQRIINGVSFLTNVAKSGHYDAHMVEKYLPTFLNLVAAYVAGDKINMVQLDEEPRMATPEAAHRIFTEQEEKEIDETLKGVQ